MTEDINAMSFSCEEHRKCYVTLQQVIEEGILKPTPEMIGRITEGIPNRIFHKSLLNKPWKAKFVELINQEAAKWEKDGGTIGNKLRFALQELVEAGIHVQAAKVCTKAGVSQWHLVESTMKYTWQRELYKCVKAEEYNWEKHGGMDGEKCREALQVMLDEGERPAQKKLSLKMGKDKNYFNKDRLTFLWKKTIVDSIIKHDQEWQQCGTKMGTALRLTLQNYIDTGKRPQVQTICDEVGYASTNIEKPNFPWQITLKEAIKKADLEWQQHGGMDAMKSRQALDEIIKDNQIPTPANVAEKVGRNSAYLKQDVFPWKHKLLDDIEQVVSGGLDEIVIFYMDIKTLIKKEFDSKKSVGDYRNFGISIMDSKSKIVNYYCLSHLMYDKYRYIVKSNNQNRLFVDKNSYKQENKVYVDGIIRGCEGLTFSQLNATISKMIVAALWLNDNNYVINTLDEAKDAFCNYSYYLHRILKSGDRTHSVAYIEQSGMIRLLSGMFSVENSEITKDASGLLIPVKAPRSNAYNNAAKFTQEELGYAFGFYFHLFDQLADFVLGYKSFPHVIQLPRGSATLLGVGTKLITPSYELPKQLSIGIDPIDGHILSDDELQALAVTNKVKYPKSYFQYRETVVEKLSELNNDKAHSKRLQIGKKALDSWFMCMLYLTVANDSTLGTYIWSDEDKYEIEHNDRKEFVTIKPRAYNKKIRFTMPKAFMPSFKKFIKLRRYVLNGHTIPHLFFKSGFGENAKIPKEQYQGCMGAMIAINMIEQLDSQLPNITSRHTRKDGARDVLVSHGVDIALAVLQNKFDAFINHYGGKTVEENASDVSDLLENIHHCVIADKPYSKRKQNAMGGCDNGDELNPKTLSKDSPVEADCNDQKTCIFCSYFISFPETAEIRKLISLQYLIENTAYDRTEYEAFYEKMMEPWLKRIEVIFEQMIEKEPKAELMKKQITKEVYEEGLLSPYWLDWVTDLDELGRFA